ncbi:MAG: LacI family DNA-binding transcriptional regulator [Actinomycetota bacterium]|jgi:LacI family repressor for deo operon, udp, cdd, tsx, nupC, and nupG|nr:LacI family DNA-binding transcriptional regulator [Actinomycetota bacterium]MDA3015632.1 LacI family DNA-binding transcriptional regulator [Actinomycetota bacterium]MDA3027479.1 LacI family DNA-binding transcriptional regulator [Actinomycetota bacterium]
MPQRAARDRPTIDDVAAAAGVSVATVSRALRGLPNVAPATRQAVVDAASRLDYHADPAATRLASGRTGTIGVVVPLLGGWYFAQVVAGIEEICAEQGLDLIVMSAASHEHLDRLADDSARLRRRVDGLIFVDYALADSHVDRFHDIGIEVVSIGAASGGFPTVGIDDRMVGEIATRHLLELGHTRIAVVGAIGDPRLDPFRFAVPRLRLAGSTSTLAESGLSLDASMVLPGGFTVDGGAAAGDELFSRADPPTAVFALSDEMAFGVHRAAREHGLRVPDDVSIIGVDDHEMSAVIGLTTIAQDVSGHGSTAARLLIDQLSAADTKAVEHICHDVTLVPRSSTSPNARPE